LRNGLRVDAVQIQSGKGEYMNNQRGQPMSNRVTIELMDVENVIKQDIASGCTQKEVAKTYALGLRSSWPTDWAKVNAMILVKWPKGLNRIKEMAWNGKCFNKPVVEANR
jgi:hypothetical protein